MFFLSKVPWFSTVIPWSEFWGSPSKFLDPRRPKVRNNSFSERGGVWFRDGWVVGLPWKNLWEENQFHKDFFRPLFVWWACKTTSGISPKQCDCNCKQIQRHVYTWSCCLQRAGHDNWGGTASLRQRGKIFPFRDSRRGMPPFVQRPSEAAVGSPDPSCQVEEVISQLCIL